MFNANYLAYADEAVMSVWRELGCSYPEMIARGLDTSVVASELQWSSPARWGDVIDVHGAVEQVGRTSVVLTFSMSVGDRLCCQVRTTYVLVDSSGRPTPVPDDLRSLWS